MSKLGYGWFCTNCGFKYSIEPSDPCPKCNCAIWERELPSGTKIQQKPGDT